MAVPILRHIGFCGADDSIHPEILASVSARYMKLLWRWILREDVVNDLYRVALDMDSLSGASSFAMKNRGNRGNGCMNGIWHHYR